MNETHILARHATSLDLAELPARLVDKTKQHILDTLGIIVRAQHDSESSHVFANSVASLCGPDGNASAIGHERSYPPHYAALLNAAYAHSIEFDDTHAAGSIHPGAVVVPAALAVAEESGATGALLLLAVVAGYETACRVSMGLPSTAHLNRGFHPTATAGTFGAAAAAAVAAGCEAGVLEHAFGLCGSMAAGSMQFQEDSSWNKRFHVGMAAHNGLLALRFATNGILGATQALEGKRGFWKAYGGDPQPQAATEALGQRWMVNETGFKPYPTCRSTHSPIDSILHLMRSENLHADDIESMHIGLSVKGVDIVGSPEESKRIPKDDVDAPFSMHWTAAVAAIKNRMSWADHGLVHDPAVLALAQRITVGPDAACDALWPGHFASLVVIRARGREYRRFVEDAKGDANLPMTWSELEEKFHSLCEDRLPMEVRLRIVAMVHDLENLEDISPMMRLLRGAPLGEATPQ